MSEKRTGSTGGRRLRTVTSKGSSSASEPTRWEMFRSGDLLIAGWTDEEIASGAVSGMPEDAELTDSEQITLRRELFARSQRKYEGLLLESMDVLGSIMRYGDTDSARLAAIKAIQDRAMGRTPERVDVGNGDAFSRLLQDVISDDEILPKEQAERAS